MKVIVKETMLPTQWCVHSEASDKHVGTLRLEDGVFVLYDDKEMINRYPDTTFEDIQANVIAMFSEKPEENVVADDLKTILALLEDQVLNVMRFALADSRVTAEVALFTAKHLGALLEQAAREPEKTVASRNLIVDALDESIAETTKVRLAYEMQTASISDLLKSLAGDAKPEEPAKH